MFRTLFNSRTRLLVQVANIGRCSRTMAQMMDRDKAKEILDNVDNFLFDCDGEFVFILLLSI